MELSMKLYLDDVRKIPDESREEIRTPEHFETTVKACIRMGIEITDISFDHDLAYEVVGIEITGHDCLKWLLNQRPIQELPLPNIHFHTANPVGLANMESLLRTYKIAQEYK
jgi:hypothetical protein